jgi:hypothetical protein
MFRCHGSSCMESGLPDLALIMILFALRTQLRLMGLVDWLDFVAVILFL